MVGTETPKSDKAKKKIPLHHHLDNCGAVVRNGKGTYVELRCDKCHGNSGRVTKKFLSGVRGFSKHFRAVHKESPSPAEILQRCAVRDLTADEVVDINSGEVHVSKYPCASGDAEAADHSESAET